MTKSNSTSLMKAIVDFCETASSKETKKNLPPKEIGKKLLDIMLTHKPTAPAFYSKRMKRMVAMDENLILLKAIPSLSLVNKKSIAYSFDRAKDREWTAIETILDFAEFCLTRV